MSDESPVVLPRKKLNVLWFLLGAVVLLVAFFCYQLFGPSPPIVVSPATTYITAPLGKDGLPDYEAYLLEKSCAGVTPENNAAPLLLRAVGPGELNPADFQAVCAAVGLSPVPTKSEALQPTYSRTNRQRITEWLSEKGPIAPETDTYEGDVEKAIGNTMSRPWTSDGCPPMALWVKENERPLDWIVEATSRPRYFSPSPSFLNGSKDQLFALSFENIQAMREAARGLMLQAMWNLGEGRRKEAWRDLMAAHRLGRLVAQGDSLIEQLVGIGIDGMTHSGTLQLLADRKLTADEARQIERDLAALPKVSSMSRSIDVMERLEFLDCVVLIGQGGLGTMQSALNGNGQGREIEESLLNTVSVDWNLVLVEGNRWYDQIVAAARKSDWTARQQAFSQLDTDLRATAVQLRQPGDWVGGVLSRTKRSEMVSAAILNLFLPAVDAAFNAQDRADTQSALLRLAAALAVYRAEHGAYPENLDALVPDMLPEPSVDLFHTAPFVYRREGEGYLLYSAGANGQDDGGSSEWLRVLAGRSVDELPAAEQQAEEEKIPSGADDFAIRVPMPVHEEPKKPAANGDEKSGEP